ncbi:DUF350 domain-containing protein [Paenibacillus sp. MWE-103]|uniref:DUF350 domain-containing protein n=1 Tax=Paenibacillus artemisiicola TaxID=1172618 RepID=A0ABS3W9B0_9BACL|nr:MULTISPECIES: DUF350 domain-containing protein [Paenibacillus]MBO7744905.1 DUF350 domain-containing protein [Paenibacillus artemisiicola]SFI28055.1 Uncharacterized membrane protein YjfL, UPF0719 family [Paenibacillus sp. UNC496MF]
MTLDQMLGILVWTGAGAVLLIVLMAIDSLFTRYKDLEEIKNGNVAVTTRFIMKLIAQAFILSRSIATSDDLWEALVVSAISFVILLLIESLVEFALRAMAGLDLTEGTRKNQIASALFTGSLHLAGALIIGACL